MSISKKKFETEMTANVQENKSKHTKVQNERFLISTRQNDVRIFGVRCL